MIDRYRRGSNVRFGVESQEFEVLLGAIQGALGGLINLRFEAAQFIEERQGVQYEYTAVPIVLAVGEVRGGPGGVWFFEE